MAWTDLGAWTSRATITKTRLDQITDNFTELKLHTHDNTNGDGATLTNAAMSNRTRRVNLSLLGHNGTFTTSISDAYIACADAATTTVNLWCPYPADLASGSIYLCWAWSGTGGGTGQNVYWRRDVGERIDGSAYNSLLSTLGTDPTDASAVSDTVVTRIALTGTPSSSNPTNTVWAVAISRAAADANDAYNGGTVRFHGAWIEYTADM